jgi:hypothetical protein
MDKMVEKVTGRRLARRTGSFDDTFAWLNPEFMSRWEARGQVVSIEAGRTATLKARLFSKDD